MTTTRCSTPATQPYFHFVIPRRRSKLHKFFHQENTKKTEKEANETEEEEEANETLQCLPKGTFLPSRSRPLYPPPHTSLPTDTHRRTLAPTYSLLALRYSLLATSLLAACNSLLASRCFSMCHTLLRFSLLRYSLLAARRRGHTTPCACSTGPVCGLTAAHPDGQLGAHANPARPGAGARWVSHPSRGQDTKVVPGNPPSSPFFFAASRP